MLKQAERDGIISNLSIEFTDAPTVELQNAVDSLVAANNGSLLLGERARYAGTKVLKDFEKFLMSTSLASERANRMTAFIADVLFERSRGNTDVRDQYSRATMFANQANFVG